MTNKLVFFTTWILTMMARSGASGGVSDEPHFVEAIQNVTVTAGRDAKLSCVVENLGSFKVAWIAFDKSAILTVQDHVITRNPRVNVSHDGHRTWILHLSNVNSSDAGTYMCQVNTIVAKSHYGVINVVVPPYIEDDKSSGDIDVAEGSNVTLACSTTGIPKPTVTWRREDGLKINVNNTYSVMEHIGSALRLSPVSRTDMAAYMCIARNGVPPIVSKRIQVSVNFPPMMSIPHQLVGAPEKYSVTLECHLESYPPALTYWTRGDEVMLPHSNKYHIVETKDKKIPYRTNMKLTIRNIEFSDFGAYKCVAKNSRGDTEGIMKLYKTEPPTTPSTNPPFYLEKLFKGYQHKTNGGSHEELFSKSDADVRRRPAIALDEEVEEHSEISRGEHPKDKGSLVAGVTTKTYPEKTMQDGFEHSRKSQEGRREEGHYFTNFFNGAKNYYCPSNEIGIVLLCGFYLHYLLQYPVEA